MVAEFVCTFQSTAPKRSNGLTRPTEENIIAFSGVRSLPIPHE
jgi:hypothetical protein